MVTTLAVTGPQAPDWNPTRAEAMPDARSHSLPFNGHLGRTEDPSTPQGCLWDSHRLPAANACALTRCTVVGSAADSGACPAGKIVRSPADAGKIAVGGVAKAPTDAGVAAIRSIAESPAYAGPAIGYRVFRAPADA